ncbi:STAS domain-containing protein [Streptomyces bohaiensis]|uniref:STAS domain-containing protein n=1 Tax=Streptomyces bohaiensis TaxID=1431344 RepID=UPI003B7ABA4D
MTPDHGSAVVVQASPALFLITASGDLDLDDIHPLEEALTAATQSRSRCTVLDLSGVPFADSEALNTLLAAHSAHRAAGRPWEIAGPYSPRVERLFALTGARRVLPLASDLSAARRLAGCHGDEHTDARRARRAHPFRRPGPSPSG